MSYGSHDNPPRPLLPSRELQVLRLLSEGLTQQQAAAQLHLSYEYTRELVGKACRTLGAENAIQAVVLAIRSGLF